MGNDVNESTVHKIWRDSMLATGHHMNSSKLTYDDFVLLMKGQTRDAVVKAGRLCPESSCIFEEGAEDNGNLNSGQRSIEDCMVTVPSAYKCRPSDFAVTPVLLTDQSMKFERRRSWSADNDCDESVGVMLDIPRENDKAILSAKTYDEQGQKTSLKSHAANRKLYQAHRQMRLAVLEASKRFEENQARHACANICAHADNSRGEIVRAGLVSRRGFAKPGPSEAEAVRKLLQQNSAQQTLLVEQVNRRGARSGRRIRKKTISDMSGMLSHMDQDKLPSYFPSQPLAEVDEIHEETKCLEAHHVSFTNLDA